MKQGEELQAGGRNFSYRACYYLTGRRQGASEFAALQRCGAAERGVVMRRGRLFAMLDGSPRRGGMRVRDRRSERNAMSPLPFHGSWLPPTLILMSWCVRGTQRCKR